MDRQESAKSEGNRQLVDYMVSAGEGHDPVITATLARASMWAYSELTEFQLMLRQQGLDCLCIKVTFENEALFVSPYAYFAQSRDGRLAILCFRGTRPVSLITWLMSTNVRTAAFRWGGFVHGGFYRATSALWPRLKLYLGAAMRGKSICRTLLEVRPPKSCSPRRSADRAARRRRGERSEPDEAPRSTLKALYITGHSLGGALAVLTAARIYTNGDVEELRSVLRGVYTFGQPMVGDRTFARAVGRKFERKLFRHIYRNDIVPRLPPRTLGHFEHFGQEYIEKSGNWMYRRETTEQAPYLVLYMTFGILALIMDQFPRFRRVRLPVSWSDHSPLYYLLTSQKLEPGSEFE
ncbi:hypothetical protein BE17_10665 [Sorangium cellulosum]|uniref:Fungal lipase-type domain-containing protein n=1 Tax=Sorangium cellulosum TaxID=56 RepID=A0A150RT93_SORCE|nr:hypothetical protein BE17_10665 [Sorangium cellulosum]